jgi:hypothetical protein
MFSEGDVMHSKLFPSHASLIRWFRLATVAGVLALLQACGSPTPPKSADGWLTLFDGSSLDFWTIVGDANWHLEDGGVAADQSTANSFLVSQDSYTDFELELEFWVDSAANSGIFLRCQNPEAIDESSCYEVNIYDMRSDQTYRTGGIVNLAEPDQFVYTGGQWNRYAIAARGDHLEVTLNGKDMIDLEDSKLASGHLALQYGSGTVKFRNVRLRPL